LIGRAGPSLERPLGRILAFAGACAVVITARVFDRGEPYNDRTYTLIFLAFLGGLIGSAPVFLLLATRLGRGLKPVARLVLGAVLTTGGFLAATYLAFGIHLKFLREPDELDFTSPDFDIGHLHVVGRMIDAMGLFVVTGQRYFLFWPIAAVALIGGWLSARPYGGMRVSSPAQRGRGTAEGGGAGGVARRRS
jgi:hypothetical protein